MRLLQPLADALKARRQYFSQGRQDIAEENLVTLQIAGSVGSVVCGIFFLIAPLIIPSWRITVEYYFVVPILLLTFLFAFFYQRRKAVPDPRVVEFACVLFYVLLLAVFIALSVFPYPNTPQIFVSLCFMFMPVLLIQHPLIQLSLMAAAETVFLLLAARYKTIFAIENDIFNTVAALFFAVIIMGVTNRLRCRNYTARATLEQLSQTDALTGLLNKTAFEQCCAAFLASSEAAQGYALLVADLDDFKQVNDNYGHPFGDAMLKESGRILLETFRKSDLAGRIGGDEFAVLLRGVTDPALLHSKCTQINRRFADIVIDDIAIHPACSMGAVISREMGATYAAIFRTADSALYRSKRRQKGTAIILEELSSGSV